MPVCPLATLIGQQLVWAAVRVCDAKRFAEQVKRSLSPDLNPEGWNVGAAGSHGCPTEPQEEAGRSKATIQRGGLVLAAFRPETHHRLVLIASSAFVSPSPPRTVCLCTFRLNRNTLSPPASKTPPPGRPKPPLPRGGPLSGSCPG